MGSRLTNVDTIPFKYEPPASTKLSEIDISKRGSTININVKLRWLEDKRTVHFGELRITKVVRDGILADETGAMKLSICGDLVDQVQEDIVYQFTYLEVRDYFGLKLTTTTITSIKINAIEINVDCSLHNVEMILNYVVL